MGEAQRGASAHIALIGETCGSGLYGLPRLVWCVLEPLHIVIREGEVLSSQVALQALLYGPSRTEPHLKLAREKIEEGHHCSNERGPRRGVSEHGPTQRHDAKAPNEF